VEEETEREVNLLGRLRPVIYACFHIIRPFCFRSNAMLLRGTCVKVEIHLQSSLFPSWKELSSAIKHKDKVESQ